MAQNNKPKSEHCSNYVKWLERTHGEALEASSWPYVLRQARIKVLHQIDQVIQKKVNVRIPIAVKLITEYLPETIIDDTALGLRRLASETRKIQCRQFISTTLMPMLERRALDGHYYPVTNTLTSGTNGINDAQHTEPFLRSCQLWYTDQDVQGELEERGFMLVVMRDKMVKVSFE